MGQVQSCEAAPSEIIEMETLTLKPLLIKSVSLKKLYQTQGLY